MKSKFTKKAIFISSLPCLILCTIFIVFNILPQQEVYSNTNKNSSTNMDTQETLTETTLLERITIYLDENEILEHQISIAIYDPSTQQSYQLYANEDMFSASLYKVPLAMLYYEYIEEGTIFLEDTLLYSEDCYEEGGPIASTYGIGSYIGIEELLYDMIVYSDNTAAHILFEHLGGWTTYRTLIEKYSAQTFNASFYEENVFPASYATDVLQYLYQHASIYKALIQHMKLVYPQDYLGKKLDVQIAQKYGSYETYENAMGIVYGEHPYLITIMTSLGNEATQVIGEINEIAYNFFHEM